MPRSIKKNTRLYELVTGWLPQECFSKNPVDDSTGKQPSNIFVMITGRSEKVTPVIKKVCKQQKKILSLYSKKKNIHSVTPVI
jgi:hypothetical protein